MAPQGKASVFGRMAAEAQGEAAFLPGACACCLRAGSRGQRGRPVPLLPTQSERTQCLCPAKSPAGAANGDAFMIPSTSHETTDTSRCVQVSCHVTACGWGNGGHYLVTDYPDVRDATQPDRSEMVANLLLRHLEREISDEHRRLRSEPWPSTTSWSVESVGLDGAFTGAEGARARLDLQRAPSCRPAVWRCPPGCVCRRRRCRSARSELHHHGQMG